jgi:hypothetical protein
MSAVAYQLATPFTVLLAWPLLAERPSLTTSAGVVTCIRRRGRVGSGAWPVGKRASAAACGRGSLRVRGVQHLDEALRPF